ncbi:MAG: DNA polymerase/3'-5' exonuclease PolX [Candidatus Pacebacteria bacterium]|nr:DNA polymerase/3'-5' exonuclease PolX [Candidatus Paceibacterota bacterium]MDD4830629.1 DNA polymerase/3'-5' exonuclease PolX [Candidatus Paceibacterota bacterium]
MNQDLAKILYEIGDFLESEEVPFKPYAYKSAAITVDSLEKNIADIYKKGGLKALEEIPGVGDSIAKKIEEYIKTGRIKYHRELQRKLPVKMEELIAVEGMGPKRAKFLFQKLGVANLKDLEKAAKQDKISTLFGFGPKAQANILQSIEFLKRAKGRFLLGEIFPTAQKTYNDLKNLKEVRRIDFAGSLRRRKETIGDIDFLAASNNPKKVMDFFVNLPGIVKVWGKGGTKASVRMKQGFDMDIRVVPEKSYGSALQYFTGSKEHNIILRKIAIEKGMKLSEYGLFKGDKMVAGKDEKEIYNILGLDWIAPEIRENRGEIEAAKSGSLPKLIKLEDIRGDLHCHTDWNGGENSIKEMAEKAIELNYDYIGISDHTKYLKIENGLDEKKLKKQKSEIVKINLELQSQKPSFRILHGAETNILKDGSIDIKDDALAELDYAIAGVHSHFKMEKQQMTERIIKAMKNPNIKIIAHPTGRILKKRDEYEVDFAKLLRAAKEFNTALEINACPERLDLNDVNIRKAKDSGVKMAINTDSHVKDRMRFMEMGAAQARRGWAEPADIINSWPLEKLLEYLRHRK